MNGCTRRLALLERKKALLLFRVSTLSSGSLARLVDSMVIGVGDVIQSLVLQTRRKWSLMCRGKSAVKADFPR
jgi:hypothetical protein